MPRPRKQVRLIRRRVSVLWLPPGARRFASRQAWGRQVAYGSQFETPHDRALSAAQDIRYELGGKIFVSLDEITPPKPKGMHRRTFEAKIKRLNRYESVCSQYEMALSERLKRANLTTYFDCRHPPRSGFSERRFIGCMSVRSTTRGIASYSGEGKGEAVGSEGAGNDAA